MKFKAAEENFRPLGLDDQLPGGVVEFQSPVDPPAVHKILQRIPGADGLDMGPLPAGAFDIPAAPVAQSIGPVRVATPPVDASGLELGWDSIGIPSRFPVAILDDR